MGFELFCSLLKKYRITCKNLDVNCFDDKIGPSKEQCVGLLKNLKPNIVSLRSEGSNRFEAVSAWKGLVIYIRFYLESDILEKSGYSRESRRCSFCVAGCLPVFQLVYICRGNRSLCRRTVLQYIRENPSSNKRTLF